MELDVKPYQDILFVQVKGELDLAVAKDFRNILDEKLNYTQARHLYLDFTQVEFIDSSGLGVILGRYKRLQEIGGTVKIYGVQGKIGNILELSGLSRIIEINSEPYDILEITSF